MTREEGKTVVFAVLVHVEEGNLCVELRNFGGLRLGFFKVNVHLNIDGSTPRKLTSNSLSFVIS